MLAVLMASLETSIIATALPTLAGELGSPQSFAWVGTAYIVTSAIATPLFGKLSDLYGRRRIFLTTMVIFFFGSLACGLAQSMNQLIAARALQGTGGGAIQALAFAIIADVIPPRERGRYIGYFTLAFVGAALFGPLIGGYIIDHYSWPWIFFINIPFCVVVFTTCWFALRLPFQRREAKLDYLGAAILSIGIASLMIGLEQGSRDGWTETLPLTLFVVAGVSLVVFLPVERRADEPMIPLRLFGDRVVLFSVVLGSMAGMVTYGASQFLPLYFQDSLFVSPTESGLRMLPQMIGVLMATFGIGRLIAKSGRYRPYPIAGTIVATVGLVAIAQITGTTSYWYLIVPMIFMGFGTASVFTTTSIASQNAVDFRDLGVTTATVMFFRSLGGALGLAAFGTIFNATIRSEIPARLSDVPADEAMGLIRTPAEIAKLPEAERQAVSDAIAIGVSHIYWICAAVMVLGVVCAILLPERPLRTRAGLSDALENKAVAH